jgi:hypothetical protein
MGTLIKVRRKRIFETEGYSGEKDTRDKRVFEGKGYFGKREIREREIGNGCDHMYSEPVFGSVPFAVHLEPPPQGGGDDVRNLAGAVRGFCSV